MGEAVRRPRRGEDGDSASGAAGPASPPRRPPPICSLFSLFFFLKDSPRLSSLLPPGAPVVVRVGFFSSGSFVPPRRHRFVSCPPPALVPSAPRRPRTTTSVDVDPPRAGRTSSFRGRDAARGGRSPPPPVALRARREKPRRRFAGADGEGALGLRLWGGVRRGISAVFFSRSFFAAARTEPARRRRRRRTMDVDGGGDAMRGGGRVRG